MDKLKRDPSYSIDAIRPVTHVCKARATRARAHPHRSNRQSEKNDQGHLQNYRPMRN